MFKWKESYTIGIELVDVQHKHLFDLGNTALELITTDSYLHKNENIIQLVEDLLQYTKFHFLSEETYMLQICYPLYNIHKEEHDAFIEKINNIDLNNISSNQNEVIKDLVTFLLNWILNHILQKDKLIAID